MLPLEQYHRQNLHQRGLSDTEIARRQYRTLPTRGRAEFARRLVDGFGAKRCAQIQGLYIRAEDGRRWWSLAGAFGLLIPVRNIKGRVIGLIVRSDDPDADPRYSAVSAKARGGPGPGAHIHVPLFEKAITHSVRLTEGAVKADVATVRNGTLTLGLPGVSAWRRALPVLGKLHIRSVILAFDADARHNWTVARALQRSAAAIRATGVEVVLEYWAEDDGEGINDLLTAGKTPERLSGLAAIEAIRAIVRAAYTSDPLL
jgi:DNA primase